MLLILAILIAAWPLIAKAITIDETAFYPQSGDTGAIALTPKGDIMTLSSTTDGMSAIAQIAPPKRGASVLNRIAWCESRNDPNAKNPTSTASGRFQILHGSWEYYGTLLWGTTAGHSVFNYADNTAVATFMYEKEGTSPWAESATCWNK